ncbi:MAG: glycosyltransferase [Bacteroidales bacterium]|nr:glycosyltransferase [Bacteroidales bacterium]
MRVLWLSTCVPNNYNNGGRLIASWQDSLENIVRRESNIQLAVAFPSEDKDIKDVNGVRYYPLKTTFSISERLWSRVSAEVITDKCIEKALDVICDFKPDVIQVFGTEFGFGLIASRTTVPVVVHIQGAMLPYDNAKFPPGYNSHTYHNAVSWNPLRILNNKMLTTFRDSRVKMEKHVWHQVKHYMGRTDWDYAVSRVLCPDSTYHHVDEALRPEFLEGKYVWQVPSKGSRLRLVSVGCSNLWKGLDMMHKTARILKQMNVDFEWNVCGRMPNDFRMLVEYQEKVTFKEVGINVMGMTPADKIAELLCSSTLYVHSSYIENSPNSICEAQCIGIPVISTNVGGISTLVRNGEDGILVPANDPYQMAYAIVALSRDEERMKYYSTMSMQHALTRHDPHNIMRQLIDCYNSLCNNQ